MSLNSSYQTKAHHFIPAGAHTYSRADDSYPLNAPPVLERGEGAYVWDMDGRRLLDYGMALRAITLGYNVERVSRAAYEQIQKGNNLTRASKIEIEAAEALCSLIPWVEMVKFAKNGSTVTTAAVKLARAYTGKKYVARCAQHAFFSYDDWFVGSTVMDSGIPEQYRSLTLTFDYNDPASIDSLFQRYPGEIAAIIMEPATTEEPKDGFLQKAKEICHRNGALLILDEMITGFRWHLQGACKYYGVVPDLVTFGKGMANGFSVAALGGRRDIMDLGGIHHDKERVFLISTTYGAEMSGLGALVETLKLYQELDVIKKNWDTGRSLITGMNEIAAELGIAQHFQAVGVPCAPNFVTCDPTGAVSLEYRTLFVQEMVKRSILMPYIATSYAHGPEEVAMTLEACRASLKVYRDALQNGIEHYLVGRAIKPVFRKKN